MESYKHLNNNKSIKNYFALMLMLLAVISGNTADGIAENAKVLYRTKAYSLKSSKAAYSNKNMHALHAQKYRRTIAKALKGGNYSFEYLRGIALSGDAEQLIVYICIGIMLFYIACHCNDWLSKNNIWRNTVF